MAGQLTKAGVLAEAKKRSKEKKSIGGSHSLGVLRMVDAEGSAISEDEKTWRGLVKLSVANRISITDLVRVAIDEFLNLE